MRIAFFALVVVALAGCFRGPGTGATPENKVESPSADLIVKDTLAFLPRDSEIVVDIDLARIRVSPLWAPQLEPQTHQLSVAKKIEELRKACGIDYIQATSRLTIGLKRLGEKISAVAVVRGPDAAATLACVEKDARKKAKAKVTRDRDALLIATDGPRSMAMTAVGRTTLVALLDEGANRAMLAEVVAAGTPLRSAPAFMALYDQLEPSAAISAIANGSSPTFEPMRTFGISPRWLVVTATITDSYVVMGRILMGEAAEAQKLAGMIQSNLGGLRSSVETLDVRADDVNVRIDIVITKDQAAKMLGLLGGAFAP